MALISPPGLDTVDRQDEQGSLVEVNAGWRIFLMAVYRICFRVSQSGTTAQRPTAGPLLWIGGPYFDTTLNRPIWWTGTQWIKADGTVV